MCPFNLVINDQSERGGGVCEEEKETKNIRMVNMTSCRLKDFSLVT